MTPLDWNRRSQRVHLVGIGGSGMSAIASVLLDLGHQVTGSDLTDNRSIQALTGRGARIFMGHRPDQVHGSQVVVVSTAIAADNPERLRARELGIPVVARAEMLCELMRFKHGVAVAGTHGKTTTTALIAHIWTELGLDPTAVVGGWVQNWNAAARLGRGDCIVVEADESDGSFMVLRPSVAVWTNAEPEHLEAYGDSFDRLLESFVAFTRQVPFYGSVVACVDDPAIRGALSRIERPTVRYGLSETADVRAEGLSFQGLWSRFTARLRGWEVPVHLPLIGRHNVQNATAALAVAAEFDLDLEDAAEALASFRGVDRRFSIRGEPGGVLVADDYGHHPTEIATTLNGVEAAFRGKRIWVGFQPHRHSRTHRLFEQFAESFRGAAGVWVSPVYGAGEPSLDESVELRLARAIRDRSGVAAAAVASTDELEAALVDAARPGDLILLFGAGNVNLSSGRVIERLARTEISNERDQ